MEETTCNEKKCEETTAEGSAVPVDPAEGRTERMEKLAKNHILAAMGVGLIPIPLLDLVALMGIQLDMIKKLSTEYDVPFKKDIGKSIVGSLIGGLLPASLGGAVASMVKFLPVIGQTTSAVTMPVIAGAATYAVFKVFVQHFESGGTFLDLDPSKVKSFFSEQFNKGKTVVTDMKPEVTEKPA